MAAGNSRQQVKQPSWKGIRKPIIVRPIYLRRTRGQRTAIGPDFKPGIGSERKPDHLHPSALGQVSCNALRWWWTLWVRRRTKRVDANIREALAAEIVVRN